MNKKERLGCVIESLEKGDWYTGDDRGNHLYKHPKTDYVSCNGYN